MLTSEEQKARYDSVLAMRLRMIEEYCSLAKQREKLHAFRILFEPPDYINELIHARIEKLAIQETRAHELAEKLEKAGDSIYARPTIISYDTFNGKRKTITAGILPNGEPTSIYEPEALRMLKEYYENDKLPF